MVAVGRVPADARARRCQQPQLRPRQVAGANQQHRTDLQIEKYRQESHATLACPTCGVDWNYFLYMSRSAPAKRRFFLLCCTATIEFSPSEAKGQRCIFSTTTKSKTGWVGQTRPGNIRSRILRPMGASISPPWITSTPSK